MVVSGQRCCDEPKATNTVLLRARQFFDPVSLLAQRYTVLQSAITGAERIFQLLDEKIPVGSGMDSAQNIDQTITLDAEGVDENAVSFQDVDFSYKEGTPVLTQVSFSVKRGEKIALVGATGAGKTTVTSLLLRLYEPLRGKIFVFGKNTQTLTQSELRRLCSVVPQDVILFSGTLLSNIALGDENPSRLRVEQALQKLQEQPSGLSRK